jgi:putative DNA primase/helicase
MTAAKEAYYELASALGGFVSGPWIRISGPGHSKHDDSLSFLFDSTQPDEIRVYSFADDDPGVCREHIKAQLEKLSAGGSLTVELDENVAAKHVKTEKALKLWEASVCASGTVAQEYLLTRACLPASAACLSEVLRFHPNCPMGTGYFPAMVSIMRDVITGQPTGIHRTALADDGSAKRTMSNGMPAKMMLGRAKGAAVMLSNSAPVMGIAEGIETALSAQKIFGMPVWACMSAPGIAGFPALHGLNHLTIFADHDEAGLKAAKNCASRYQKRGINAEVRLPQKAGDDWNSFLLKETA